MDLLKDDREIVLGPSSRTGMICNASAALKDDRAVKQNGSALTYASAALQDDREIVLEAVKRDEKCADARLGRRPDDREIVLEVVKQDGVR